MQSARIICTKSNMWIFREKKIYVQLTQNKLNDGNLIRCWFSVDAKPGWHSRTAKEKKKNDIFIGKLMEINYYWIQI